MTKFIKTALLGLGLATPILALNATTALANNYAAPAAVQTIAPIQAVSERDFVKKRKSISGSWSLISEGGQNIIRFSDDFKTRSGPDLKIFLSPQTIDAVTGKTATSGALKLGLLQSNTGAQDYIIPASVDLANFASVLIHCEAYSVLWGGGAL